MAQASDVVYLPVLPSMRGFSSALTKQGSAQAAAGGKTLGATMGKAMVVGVAAAAAGIAAVSTVLYNTGKTFDDVNNTIRVGTGASGKALDELNDVAKNVGRNVPAEWDKIATTVADLNTRLGLSGDTLDTVASQYLEAGRILGEDVDIEKTSKAFTAFGIEGDAVSGAMDHLFRVSQATGIGMNDLAEKTRQASPAADALGFSFEETTAMVGNLDKAGLDSGKMLQAMSRRMGDVAKDGEKPRETFNRVTGEIGAMVESGDLFAAQDLAGKAFGTKNAEQFIKALEDGTLNMDDLGEVAGMTSDTILEAGQETMQFGEQWQLFKNNVMVWLEPLATRVFGAINDLLETAVQGVKDFGAAFEGGDVEGKMGRLGAKAREVFDYMENTAIPALKDFADYITDEVIPAIQDFGRWLDDNKRTIGIVAGVITAIMLPALARMGIAALVNGAKAVTGWVMQRVAAVQTGVAYVVQSIRIIGTWVAMGLAAVASGIQTAYVWALYKIEAIKGAAVYVAQRARIVASWALMAGAAVASGARTALVWAVQVVGAAVAGAASFMRSAARVVGGWVLMSIQSLLHAGRMAAAWFIALGPIGWVTAAVIAIAALVIANWDKIAYWTKKIWSAIVDWVVGAWVSIRDRTTQLLTAIANWVRDRFNWIRDITVRIWSAIRDFISDAWVAIRTRVMDLLARLVSNIRERFNWVRDFSQGLWRTFRDRIVRIWESVRDNIVSIWDNGIKKPLNAMKTFFTDTIPGWVESGVDMIKTAWEKVANFFRKPINWVINEVWNGGIRKAFNSVADTLNLPDSLRIGKIDKIDAFAKGGNMGSGWKLVGEEGPELINTGPGWVARADQTKRLLNGDVAEGQHVRPMGGPAAWVSKIGSGLSSAWDTAKGWVLGGLANMAEATFAPLISKATTAMSEHGMMGQLGGGLVDWGFKNVLDWIRGKDNEVSANGEYEGAFTANPGGFNRPSQGPITSKAGPRNLAGAFSNYHYGVDFGAAHNSPVRAAWSGVVKRASSGFGTFGNLIVLNHGGFDTAYAHLNGYAVKPGQAVTGGQIIGRQGNTGGSLGSHLHFERHPGGFYNPGEVNSLFRDKGGLLPPGVSSVLNNTGGNEFIFNQKQFENLNRLAEQGGSGRNVTVVQHGIEFEHADRNAQAIRFAERRASRGVGVR